MTAIARPQPLTATEERRLRYGIDRIGRMIELTRVGAGGIAQLRRMLTEDRAALARILDMHARLAADHRRSGTEGP